MTHVCNIMGESPYKDSMMLLDKLCVKIILVEYIYHCHLVMFEHALKLKFRKMFTYM